MSDAVEVRIQREFDSDHAVPLPSFQTVGAAGADLRANLATEFVTIERGERSLIPTGIRLAVPIGYEAQIRPRSGLALQYGLMVCNAPGTIDSDYRGPIGVILLNTGQEAVKISHGSRIAQLIVAPVVQARFVISKNLDDTARGDSGFGSTGLD
ncbi:MAG: dUTP diphosphatase [Aestuariivita sp.]|nr:dUTP diphosphatase [Aestuariivita sp.]MCY4201479.1 dUTP diphosphatase [Aestuariivita sp.]MCY4287721.1 dUTP diphosphatase [Aestuariivita sp.]MCY4347011.1 dUTP diphosphatase [Aestuariivita sp.]